MGTFELTDIITAAGVVIIVVLLVMLAMMIRLNGKISSLQPAQKSIAPQAAPQYASADGIPGEIVAVIAAAVASMYEGTGTKATIKSVRRSEIGLPIWGKAGLMENTRPF